MDEQKFIQLLEHVLAPDTRAIKSATAELRKNYYTSPQSLILLLKILSAHENHQLRQLAANQARTLVPKHWSTIPENQKQQIRPHIFQATLNEQVPLVRHSAARVVSAIAKIDLPDGLWSDLPDKMQEAASSPNVQHREVGTFLLFTLLESMADNYMHEFYALFTLFEKTIVDTSVEVRVNTMLALGQIAMSIDTENDDASLEGFQSLVPKMVEVLKQLITEGDEARIMQGFEVFGTLIASDSKLLSKHFGDLVQFMAQIGANPDIDHDVRTQAISFLMQVVTYRKLKFQSLKIGEQLTRGILDIVTECVGDDDDDDDNELTVSSAALGLLNVMAENLPPNQTVVPLLQVFNSAASSPDPNRRQAVVRALGTCVEGAPEFIDTQLKEFFPSLVRLLDDPDLKVRAAALSGIRLLADQLAEELCKEHQKLVPALARNLDRAMHGLTGPDSKINEGLVKASCTALDSLMEGLKMEEVTPYLADLVPHLSQLYSHPDNTIKSVAIGAVGSIALAAEKEFLPYFERTMTALGPYVQKKESEEELDLRCMVTDTMGNIAQAVGKGPFQRYVVPLMHATEEGLQLGHSRLKESSFLFWSDMAKVYEDEFATFLVGVSNALFESLEQEETDLEVELGEEASDLVGQTVSIAGRNVKVAAATDNDDESEDGMDGADDDDDDDGDDDWDELIGVTQVALEKEVALEVIANVTTFTKGAFLPYLQKSVEICKTLVEHPFEGVRRAAISALFRTYQTFWNLQDGDADDLWKPGFPLKVQPSEDVMKLGGMVMTAALALWEKEDDRQTVVAIHSGIAESLRLCGPAILRPNDIEKVTKLVVDVITKKHPCQQEPGRDEPDLQSIFEEGTSEYDWLIIDTAFDVILGIGIALGEQFAQLWKIFEKILMQYASSSEHIERTSAVGCIAECIRSMDGGVTPYTSSLLKLLLHRLGDENPEVKANAAFAIGLLVEHSNKDNEIKKAYGEIFAKLEPLLGKEQSRELDNAAGCVARMISKHPDRVPLPDVIPSLISILPLKEDYEENTPVWQMILKLYALHEPTTMQLTPQLVPILAHVMGPPEDQLKDDTRHQLVQLVKYIYEKQASLIQPHQSLMAAIQEDE